MALFLNGPHLEKKRKLMVPHFSIIYGRPFHNFSASKTGDQRTVGSKEMSIDRFRSFKIVKGSVGML